MKHRYHASPDDMSLDHYHERQAMLFRQEFDEEIRKQMGDSDGFNLELKRIQKLALIGKLHPSHKAILLQWHTLYPDRFDLFCHQMSDKHRQKLRHFLQL